MSVKNLMLIKEYIIWVLQYTIRLSLQNIVRVEVFKVLDGTAMVPILSEEVMTVGQAPNQFIQWPQRLMNPQNEEEMTYRKDPLARLSIHHLREYHQNLHQTY
ncbi:unnamed protein product [Cuscuta epithymum]|uniref:DUF8039 domain-containing protein n=1 Tax=Cuscuta epithymum TaxID=186058 RepID=A0AAV0D1N2_9ASTE|nr:unnamed protein product [Cuscuta epithymum]